jgi:RecB family endonuclease NucS
LNLDINEEKTIIEKPTINTAFQAIKSGIWKHKTIIIIGNCSVDYDGRASSKLELGERIVILKQDGSALIHRPRDYNPVNWQPPGSLFRTKLDKGKLVLRVFRRKENETLEIKFDKILFVVALDLRDTGEFHLYSSEKDMQEAILIQPSLLENDFKPLEAEKPVEPGFIDIIGVDKDNVLTIVEIKRNAANNDAVLQLKKYMDVYNPDGKRKIRGIIVAPELAKGAQTLLATLGLEFKTLTPQKCAEVLKRKKGRTLTEFFD